MQGKFYIIRHYFVLAFFFISFYSFSQITHPKFENRKIHYNDFNHFLYETPWDIQFGWSAIDDDGKPFKDLLSISKAWNIGYLPSRIAISKKITKDWKGEIDFAFNTYRANKVVNSEILKEDGSFFTFDIGVQYDLNRLFGYTWIFDPLAITLEHIFNLMRKLDFNHLSLITQVIIFNIV